MRDIRRLRLSVDHTDSIDFIRQWSDLVSAAVLPEDKWLTDKEKIAFAHCLLISLEGVNLSSREAVDALVERLEANDGYVYKLRKALRDKEWLVQTPTGDVLPAEFAVGTIPGKLEFSFDISLKPPVHDAGRQNHSEGGRVLPETPAESGHDYFATGHEDAADPRDIRGDERQNRMLANRY